MDRVAAAVRGEMEPWVRRFVKQTGRGINRFRMIREGQRIILGISGGKDSLALAFALAVRKKWLPIDYELLAVHIDWKEYPIPPARIEELSAFFSALAIPYRRVEASMFNSSFKGDFNCYLCSRNRKRILFEIAQREHYDRIALGHHMDDLVETTMINLFFRGRFTTMLPVQDFFNGKLQIVRPLCEVHEPTVSRLSDAMGFPVCKSPCPYEKTNIRSQLKPILKGFYRMDKQAREHVYQAFWKEKDDFTPLQNF